MTFTITELTNERALVQGRDVVGTEGKTIVSTSQWAELNERANLNKAQLAFDDAVEEFFAPLTEAADAIGKGLTKPDDSSSYVVLDEGSEGQAHTPRRVIALTHDSIVLRMIEEGNTDRLLWVGDALEVIAVQAQAVVPAATVPGVSPQD